MNNLSLKNKHVTVVGLGLTGKSCVRFLQTQNAVVTALDSRDGLQHELNIPVFLGPYNAENLLDAELILLSPGVDPNEPALRLAANAGKEIIGDVELFARFNTRPVVAITGSNGKSTVTTLVRDMLVASGVRAEMGGNIGTPVLDLIDSDAEMFVLELSSFQLETVSSLQPKVATVLNISDDHLDRHGNMAAYQAAKLRVYHNAEHCVVNRDDAMTWTLKQNKDWTFGLDQSEQGFSWQAQDQTISYQAKAFLKMRDCLLMGSHNALNIQAAAACALLAGADQQAVKDTAKSFGGLAHRFETVAVVSDVRWINDSKATNVGATVAALEGVKASKTGKLILIAGGLGKGADFSPLQAPLTNTVDTLITLGQDGANIAALKPDAIQVDSLEQAVQQAHHLSSPGDIVLLSPACASMDMFENYQRRGECFTDAVRGLAA